MEKQSGSSAERVGEKHMEIRVMTLNGSYFYEIISKAEEIKYVY